MAPDFNKDISKYIAKKRRKGFFSNVKFNVTSNKEGAGKEITQEDIDRLVRGKDIKIGLKEEIVGIEEEKDGGWKEVKVEELQGEEAGLDKENRLAKLGNENVKGEKTESEEDKSRRLELEEGIKVLKEKQRIEEDRLVELRRARRMEQMEDLRARVVDILFKKKSTIKKDMGEEVRGEIRREAKIKEAEKQKVETKEAENPKKEVTKAEETEEGKKEIFKEAVKKEEEPKKSFFSNFIQIRTAAEIAKEEEKRLKKEEEQALTEQLEANKLLQEGEEEVRTNVPANILAKEQSVNFSTLFPEEKEVANQSSEDVIALDKEYKIKVVRNQ